jgi:single-stranded-DNA-specific exonuclease
VQEILSRKLGLSSFLSRLLVNRGITAPPAAEKFLSSTLEDLSHPFLMKDVKKAARRVLEAVYQNEKICVYGDYDADGVTGTAVLKLFLESLGARVSHYIPERLSEGYGVHCAALESIHSHGTSLIVTVDCGISDYEAVRFGRDLGMDIIVTDHHHVPERIPPANAVLNPRQPDCSFPFKHLAGVGVAFYLVIALRKILREEGFWKEGSVPNLVDYLDLVALGTLADIVPLKEENRIFVRYGLEVLSRTERIGLAELKKVSRIADGVMSAEMVAFRLAPRINAAGRLGKADKAVTLLTTCDRQEAERIAIELDETNTERQYIESTIFKHACRMVDNAEGEEYRYAIVLASSEWHAGVVGIGASRLVDRYYRPVVLIALDGNAGRGSARSIEGFHLYEGLAQCAAVLEKFGGHECAGGLTVSSGNVGELHRRFSDLVAASLSTEDFIPKMHIDAELPIEVLSEALIEEVQRLAPFGAHNPPPLFLSDVFAAASPFIVGKNHLKMRLDHNGSEVDVIGFGMADRMPDPNAPVRAVYVPEVNVWQGVRKVQMNMKDLRVVE